MQDKPIVSTHALTSREPYVPISVRQDEVILQRKERLQDLKVKITMEKMSKNPDDVNPTFRPNTTMSHLTFGSIYKKDDPDFKLPG